MISSPTPTEECEGAPERLADYFAEIQDCISSIQGALRHRQQPQDFHFHKAEKACRDGVKFAMSACALPLATAACPICQHDQPHSHENPEILSWLNAQASRFGVCVGLLGSKNRVAPEAAAILADIDNLQRVHHSAYGYDDRDLELIGNAVFWLGEDYAALKAIVGSGSSADEGGSMNPNPSSDPVRAELLAGLKEMYDQMWHLAKDRENNPWLKQARALISKAEEV